MKRLIVMTMCVSAALLTTACGQKKADFRYTVDQFADVKVIRYQVPGWDELTLQQKEYAYHLAEAAKWGRDILWDQNCRYNLQLRHAVEDILTNYAGDRKCSEFEAFTE